jgi:hypothetical protein
MYGVEGCSFCDVFVVLEPNIKFVLGVHLNEDKARELAAEHRVTYARRKAVMIGEDYFLLDEQFESLRLGVNTLRNMDAVLLKELKKRGREKLKVGSLDTLDLVEKAALGLL